MSLLFPKFYQAKLKKLNHDDVMKLTCGLSLTERMGSELAKCPECKKNNWIVLPVESPIRKQSGKPYIECMNCGYMTHL